MLLETKLFPWSVITFIRGAVKTGTDRVELFMVETFIYTVDNTGVDSVELICIVLDKIVLPWSVETARVDVVMELINRVLPSMDKKNVLLLLS